ncbi:MAG: APC family permease [Candidatus Aminicenantales bacterium]|jgi:APA family basic amino acid/polyamine antiporter
MKTAEATTATVAQPQKLELRRDVTIWGSFMWGYADVGADIYVALGLVIGAAQGAAPLAFALAGLVYIMIGLSFTELASAYPVAGGGHYYSLRGLGDLCGFLAGAALLLDYTIDIALFATASTGYVNFFLPYFGITLAKFNVNLGPFPNVNLLWLGETLTVIIFLRVLNVRGVRESSKLNEVIGVIDLLMEMSIVSFGFILAWRPELLIDQWKHQFPSTKQFMYGFSLAIISFVGLESISQAAQETRRPATVIPRTSVALIFTVFILAISFSTVGLGILNWQDFRAHESDPIAYLATHIPYLGVIAGPFAAFLGATILLISSNSGVMGDSRLIFSMSHFKLVSQWFSHVHPRFRTPSNAIIGFGWVGIVLTMAAFLTPRVLDTLANLYAFGATFGYMLVFISLIRLRFLDPYTPRPYKVPLNFKWKRKDGLVIDVPILGFIGFLGVAAIFSTVVITHQIGRIVGPLWMLICVIYYITFRQRNKLPIFRNTVHDWEREQMEVLKAAEEYESLEIYKAALIRRDKLRGLKSRWEEK